MEQLILSAKDNYSGFDGYLSESKTKNVLLVCGNFFDSLPIAVHLKSLTGIQFVRFCDFSPNPDYESVEKGVEIFKNGNFDLIMAVGGGSAIDVAKCIKLYTNLPDSECYLNQEIVQNDIPFLAVPTTAGTGSEATKYAVIYHNGEKQSITHESCVPFAVLFDESAIKTLPDYHRKSAMLDALCHAIESFWSVNSTEESKSFSKKAIKLILENMEGCLANGSAANENMLRAANLAGKAINITQTTAGHAMCYKLTSLYKIAHGHAAALCVSKLWPYMIQNAENCVDRRGKAYLENTFFELAKILNCETPAQAAQKFQDILAGLELKTVSANSEIEYEILKKSVNRMRLKNNPVTLSEKAIDELYHEILEEKQ